VCDVCVAPERVPWPSSVGSRTIAWASRYKYEWHGIVRILDKDSTRYMSLSWLSVACATEALKGCEGCRGCGGSVDKKMMPGWSSRVPASARPSC
jgi:hypothetical protein